MNTKDNTLSKDELHKVNGGRTDTLPDLRQYLPISVESVARSLSILSQSKNSDRGIAAGL